MRQLFAALEALRTRVVGMVLRVQLKSVDDGQDVQHVHVEGMGRTFRSAERVQNYGLTSRPAAGALGAAVFPQGNPEHPIVVALDDPRERPTGLAVGDVILYAAGGARVHLKNGGDLDLTSSGKIKLDADSLELSGASKVEISCGTQKITITPAGITIDATTLDINQA